MRLRWGRFLGWLTLLLILGILGLIWGGSWLLLQIIKESKEEELGKRLQAMGEIFSRELDDYAVLLEETDEMWEKIKSNDLQGARMECLQVAAMAVRFLLDTERML